MQSPSSASASRSPLPSFPPLPPLPPALLFLGDYYGTLATARSLGKLGAGVVLAGPSRFVRTAASKFVTRFVHAPDVNDVEGFGAWLRKFGRENPGHVPFAASDAVGWHLATLADEEASGNKSGFLLASPSYETTMRIYDKGRLHEACTRVGLAAPKTLLPTSEAAVREAILEMEPPFLLKPRTQVLLFGGAKGDLVMKAEDKPRVAAAFEKRYRYHPALTAREPDVAWPLVQEFIPSADTGIYSLAGFHDAQTKKTVLRASVKVLQRPRKVGIGLCFESAPVVPELGRKVTALCEELGYEGIFEIEFIRDRGRELLIDFNPRPYSQMQFEIDRGVPLPLLRLLAAAGERSALALEMDRASAAIYDPKSVYTHVAILSLAVFGQTVAKALGTPDEGWGTWLRESRGRLTDAVYQSGDLAPLAVDWVKHVQLGLRYPRGFFRSFMR